MSSDIALSLRYANEEIQTFANWSADARAFSGTDGEACLKTEFGE
jgi:hypothetical protein